jgi:hypothetical protein
MKLRIATHTMEGGCEKGRERMGRKCVMLCEGDGVTRDKQGRRE